MERIAFLGTGLMGAPMARNLIQRGLDVVVWNRSPEKTVPLRDAGASVASAPAEAVGNARFIITMMTDGPSVETTLFGSGAADNMQSGAVVIDMSSIEPSEAIGHAARLRERDIAHLDAPVSGGTAGAESGRLSIMVGGEPDAFHRAKPILEVLGRPVLVGPSGSGQLSKLANQAIVATTIGAVAEAILLMRAGGADLDRFRQALAGGFADSVILQTHGRRMAAGDFVPGGLAVNQLKDLRNVLKQAELLGLKLPLVEHMTDRFTTLVDDMSGANLDHSALFAELLSHQPAGPETGA